MPARPPKPPDDFEAVHRSHIARLTSSRAMENGSVSFVCLDDNDDHSNTPQEEDNSVWNALASFKEGVVDSVSKGLGIANSQGKITSSLYSLMLPQGEVIRVELDFDGQHTIHWSDELKVMLPTGQFETLEPASVNLVCVGHSLLCWFCPSTRPVMSNPFAYSLCLPTVYLSEN